MLKSKLKNSLREYDLIRHNVALVFRKQQEKYCEAVKKLQALLIHKEEFTEEKRKIFLYPENIEEIYPLFERLTYEQQPRKFRKMDPNVLGFENKNIDDQSSFESLEAYTNFTFCTSENLKNKDESNDVIVNEAKRPKKATAVASTSSSF